MKKEAKKIKEATEIEKLINEINGGMNIVFCSLRKYKEQKEKEQK